MRALAVLLWFFVIVHNCRAGLQVPSWAPLNLTTLLDENPWVADLTVHRNGLVVSVDACAGAVVSPSWVLTSASCVSNASFATVRLGALSLTSPDLTIKTDAFRVHPFYDENTGANDIALVNMNRNIEFTSHIRPVNLAGNQATTPLTARFCGYGAGSDANTPGESLNCFYVSVSDPGVSRFFTVSARGAVTTLFTTGAALVNDGVQYGMLVGNTVVDGRDAAQFLRISDYTDWINTVTINQ